MSAARFLVGGRVQGDIDVGIITSTERAEVNQLLGIDSRVIYPDEIAKLAAKDRRRAGACCGMIACWLVSFGGCYLACLKQLGNNQFLLDYWAGHFLPLPPTSPSPPSPPSCTGTSPDPRAAGRCRTSSAGWERPSANA